MRPCGCHVFCEECVPPLDARTSACYTCSTPFEQALPYRTGNNIAEQMVRAKFVKADVASEWWSRGAEYARERNRDR
jgi:biotin synthase-related radical SAM superfamily protein